MKYIDVFAGIGGFAQAAKAYNMQCVFASEIDKHARITYQANHGHMPAGDIKAIDAADIPDHDILMAGAVIFCVYCIGFCRVYKFVHDLI